MGKLKESGFEDIEVRVGNKDALKQRSGYSYRKRGANISDIIRESKLTYFTLLAEYAARERHFEDESDRLIMTRTAEGKSIGEISKELKDLGRPKYNRDTIRYIRRRYEHKWGIRTWKPEEMVSRRVSTP